MLGCEYDPPFNLWRRLLEADLHPEDHSGKPRADVMVTSPRIVSGVESLQGRYVLESFSMSIVATPQSWILRRVSALDTSNKRGNSARLSERIPRSFLFI